MIVPFLAILKQILNSNNFKFCVVCFVFAGSKVLDGSTPLAHHTWKQALSEQVNIVASCDVPPPSKEMWRSVLIRIHGMVFGSM